MRRNCNDEVQGADDADGTQSDGGTMVYWALMFLLIAGIAALFGFTGAALVAAGVAKILLFIFLVLFVVAFATHLTRTGSDRI